jgi:tRNA (cmo5U34)-methyltransferase
MTGRLNTFNRIAPLYDTLKGIVFGKAIYNSQIHFLHRLPDEGNLLIIGGGSGEILQLMRKLKPACHAWYVESSSRMIAMAAAKLSPDGVAYVTFIHGTEASIPSEMRFDAVVTNFFLDLFPDEKLSSICRMIASKLRPEGIWLVSDFINNGKRWQRVLLKIMYHFFAATCRIEARSLPAWQTKMHSAGMAEKDSKLFYGGFIKSTVYIKDI